MPEFRKFFAVAMALATVLVLGPSSPAHASLTPDGWTNLFQNKNDMTWSGGDQAASVRLPNGKTYWLFGDTILSNGEAEDGSYPTGHQMVANRILLQTSTSMVNAMASSGLAVPDPPTHTAENQERYWTLGGFWANNHFYVLCQRVKTDTGIGFQLVGVELAKFSVDIYGKLTLVSMVATPSAAGGSGVGPASAQWSFDAVTSGGYVYFFGGARTGMQYEPKHSYVARVPAANLEVPSNWRFWNGTTWGASMNSSAPIVKAQISSVRIINGKWVILYKDWDIYGTDVVKEVGLSPKGPFVKTKILHSPAGVWEGRNYQTYSPMLHPEQGVSGGTLVSISWNGATFGDVLANADLYKPRFFSHNF